MLNNPQKLMYLERLFAWISIGLAFLSGFAGLLTQSEATSEIATWIAIISAFLAGMFGVLTMTANGRSAALHERLKRTPPLVEVSLQSTSRLVLVIEFKNAVPFLAKWFFTTHDNTVISGFPLDWEEIHPGQRTRALYNVRDLDSSKIVGNYIKLIIDYRSIFAAELNDSRAPELTRSIAAIQSGTSLTGRTLTRDGSDSGKSGG